MAVRKTKFPTGGSFKEKEAQKDIFYDINERKITAILKELAEISKFLTAEFLPLEQKRAEEKGSSTSVEKIKNVLDAIPNFNPLENKGIITEGIAEEQFKEALEYFNKNLAGPLKKGISESMVTYHRLTDQAIKSISDNGYEYKMAVSDVKSELKGVRRHINSYESLLKHVQSPSHAATFAVLARNMLGADVDKYNDRINNDMDTVLNAAHHANDLTKSVARDWFLQHMVADINNEIYKNKSFNAGIKFFENKVMSEPYKRELIGDAIREGLMVPSKPTQDKESINPTGKSIQGDKSLGFNINGGKLIDRAWLGIAKEYWEQLKKDTGEGSEAIDKMLKELDDNKKATVADAFKSWKEINNVWLKHQKTLDKDEVDEMLKLSENASIEGLEVIWRTELTYFVKHRQPELNFKDQEIDEMAGRINVEDGEFWGKTYDRILKRLAEIEQEAKEREAKNKKGNVAPLKTPQGTSEESTDMAPPPPPTS